MSSIKKFLYGLLIGVVNIMLGAGGGMLTVPFYKKIGLSQKQAQINAVATILPITFSPSFTPSSLPIATLTAGAI